MAGRQSARPLMEINAAMAVGRRMGGSAGHRPALPVNRYGEPS